MYFYKVAGKQWLDLSGNLILSKNHDLIVARSTSAAPRKVIKGRYIINILNMSFRNKIKATYIVLSFIWRGKYE